MPSEPVDGNQRPPELECLTRAQSARIPGEPVTYLGIKALVPETERTSVRFRPIP